MTKYDFSLFLKKTENAPKVKSDILQKAALYYYIDIEKDLKEFDKSEIEQFKKKAFLRNDGTYGLSDDDRLDILENEIGLDNINKLIKKYNVNTTYADILKIANNQENISIQEFSNEELYYAISVSKLFPKRFNTFELKTIYRRRNFFKQFQNITENFTGREKELNTLSDYVDWKPKSTIIGKISHSFKRFINWNEKPPLLLKGIGGVGKSTLVAKFIIDQNTVNKNKTLPFIYIDFDLSGISVREPMTILLEALRQINIQYAGYEKLINRISDQVSELIFKKKYTIIDDPFGSQGEFSKYSQSTTSSRNYIYSTLDDIIKEYDMQISSIGNRPILVVFDSFEEMQYKATSSELHNFFNFIEEISSKIPRLRPVFAGRSEIGLYVKNVTFETLVIENFDIKSAQSLLENLGVNDKKELHLIYKHFGGNPLMLHLAANLVKKEDFDFNEIDKIEGAKWEYLINRILGHIRNEQVRKIAIPGMLVRYVNEEIIKEVLAEPTKLLIRNDNQVSEIFNELKKEVSLIVKSVDGNEFSFRQDLRMMCEEMILNQYPIESKLIREKAVKYYSNFTTIDDEDLRKKHQSEYYFHLMKKGEIPEDLTREVYDQLHSYLEHSIMEFPERVRDFLNLLGGKNTTEQSNQYDNWETNYIPIMQDALNGEFTYLKEIYNELRNLNRSHKKNGFSEFGKYKALIYQRMNRINESNQFIDEALNYRNNVGIRSNDHQLKFEFYLIKIQNLEYVENYKKALGLCYEIENASKKVNRNLRIIFEILILRIESRLNLNNTKDENRLAKLLSFRYDAEDYAVGKKWDYILSNIRRNPFKFQVHNLFNKRFRGQKRKYGDVNRLESLVRRNLNTFTNALTYAGVYDIVLRDVLFSMELIDLNSKETFE